MSSNRQIQIRPGVPGDASEIARLYIESWNSGFGYLMGFRDLSADLVERWRNDLAKPLPQRWWIAVLQDSVIGIVGIGPSRDPVQPGLGELDTIAVDPAHWRRGIGRELMGVALGDLVRDGYREAILWTVAGYDRGESFYRSTGWTKDGGTRDSGRQVRYRHDLRT